MAVPDAVCKGIWARACQEEIGIAVPTNDIRRTQLDLYEARKGGPPEWQEFMICLPIGGEELWLVRKTVELD